MDAIEYALQYMEGESRHADGPDRIYDAIDKLEKSNIKYYLDTYFATKEFQRAKLMRSNNIPVSAVAEDEKKIFVSIKQNEPTPIHGNNGNTDIREDT